MNVFYILDLLFLKNPEHLVKSLNISFSKESFETKISASGGPWNDFSLDGVCSQIHVILGVLGMEKFENHSSSSSSSSNSNMLSRYKWVKHYSGVNVQ